MSINKIILIMALCLSTTASAQNLIGGDTLDITTHVPITLKNCVLPPINAEQRWRCTA